MVKLLYYLCKGVSIVLFVVAFYIVAIVSLIMWDKKSINDVNNAFIEFLRKEKS